MSDVLATGGDLAERSLAALPTIIAADEADAEGAQPPRAEMSVCSLPRRDESGRGQVALKLIACAIAVTR